MNASIPQSFLSPSLSPSLSSSLSSSLSPLPDLSALNISFPAETQEFQIKTLKYYSRLKDHWTAYAHNVSVRKVELPGTVDLNWFRPTDRPTLTHSRGLQIAWTPNLPLMLPQVILNRMVRFLFKTCNSQNFKQIKT